MVIKGKTTNTQSIIEHYSDLNAQMRKDRQSKQDKLKNISSPQLISALDKEKHVMIVVIQPSKTGDIPDDKDTKFKFNMNQIQCDK